MSNPLSVYHEVFKNKTNLVFFDVDGTDLTLQVSDVESAIVQTLQAIVGTIKYEIRVASRKCIASQRVSYHIVLNISTDLNTNKHIAEVAGLNFSRKCKAESPFDLAVYAHNKSLRLPRCGKITKDNVLDRSAVL